MTAKGSEMKVSVLFRSSALHRSNVGFLRNAFLIKGVGLVHELEPSFAVWTLTAYDKHLNR